MTSGASQRDRVALLVHELRSPVAALAAIAEAAREEDADAAVLRELAGLAVRACRSIERIVGDAAVGSIRLEPVDVTRLLQDAITAAALAGADVRGHIDSGLEIDADPVRLRQVVDNLIGNALVHSKPSAKVVIHAERDAGRVILISVSDSGRGIAPRDHERIFEQGTRLDATGGSGLGLHVVREIVEAHGGTVTVDSELGTGATFTIALPARRS